jgi:hypothetical protein
MADDSSQPTGEAVSVAPARAAPSTLSTLPPPAPEAPDELAGEIDVWWGSYSGRTMLSSFAACLLLTAGLVLCTWMVGREYRQEAVVVRLEFYLIAALLWGLQLGLWVYRVTGLNYRLTTRHLFWSQGARSRPGSMELTDVRNVREMQNGLERWLGVGRVCITGKEPEPLVLRGVSQPERVAALIARTVEQATGRPTSGQP